MREYDGQLEVWRAPVRGKAKSGLLLTNGDLICSSEDDQSNEGSLNL